MRDRPTGQGIEPALNVGIRFVNQPIVLDKPSLADTSAADLKLWFDQKDRAGRFSGHEKSGLRTLCEGDEAEITHHNVRRVTVQMLKAEIAGVDAFKDHDTRIIPQRLVHLSVTHIDGEHFFRAAFQQNLREPASGSANVEGNKTMWIEPAGIEPRNQFECRTADIGSRIIGIRNLCRLVDVRTGFPANFAVDLNASPQYCIARP